MHRREVSKKLITMCMAILGAAVGTTAATNIVFTNTDTNISVVEAEELEDSDLEDENIDDLEDFYDDEEDNLETDDESEDEVELIVNENGALGHYEYRYGFYWWVPAKTGWVEEDGQKHYYNDEGVMVKDDSVYIEGDTYYFNKEGNLRTGWQEMDGNKYYFDEGIREYGIFELDGKKYVSGVSMDFEAGFTYINGKLYNVKKNYQISTGWIEEDGEKYYADGEGELLRGWQVIDGDWYYFGPSNDSVYWPSSVSYSNWWYSDSNNAELKYYVMASSEWAEGYWLDADGKCTYSGKATWEKDSYGWYYIDDTGYYPLSSWARIDGVWYYFDEWGYMYVNKWLTSGDTAYYFRADGSMIEGCTDENGDPYGQWVDGYFINYDGEWTGDTATWFWDGTGYKLYDKYGWSPVNRSELIDEMVVSFDANGYADTGDWAPPCGLSGSATKNEAAQTAIHSLGYPYVYGGNSLVTGTDCSGLTYLVYAQYGVSLPHNAAMQYLQLAAAGREVWYSDIQPGDLIFYNTGDIENSSGTGIGHVTMYVGDGCVAESGNDGPYLRLWGYKAASPMD